MSSDNDTPRVWAGCLACYNDGRLIGEWVDATEAGELTTEALHAHAGVTVNPLYGPHEELWVMEHENFHGLLTGECSPVEAQRIAEALDSFTGDGGDVAMFSAWINGVVGAHYFPNVADAIEAFEDDVSKSGPFDSEREALYEIAETYFGYDFNEDRWPHSYIDWDLAQENLEGFTFVRVDGRVYVFGDL